MAMKTNLSKQWSIISLIALPIAYLIYLWNKIPKEVPMHFDIHGEVDRYGSKSELIIITLLPLFIYGMMILIPKLDPKKQLDKMGNKYNSLTFIIVLFMSILAIYMIYTSVNSTSISSNFIYIMVGGLFMLLGNFFKTIKPNYFVGIRTPWTLESEEVWVKTHKMSGYLWVAGGLMIIICALLFSAEIAFYAVMAISILLAIVVVVFSYIKYKELESPKE
jgi:uncharacterized membrane protein